MNEHETIDPNDPTFCQAFRVHAAGQIDSEQAEKIHERELENARRAVREARFLREIELEYASSGRCK